jgi:hypothetical protein
MITQQEHDRFLQRLRASMPAVFAVAWMQHAKGHDIEIPALRCAPRPEDIPDYRDTGDLFVTINGKRHRIEVKWLGVNFTGAADWPFREVFVDSVSSVERANGEVSAYVSASRDLTHMAIIKQETGIDWYPVETLNRVTGNVERFYACPISAVIFKPLLPE